MAPDRRASDGGLSPHPIDELIRELIQTGRQATEAEIAQIIERMATAPFAPAVVLVAIDHRGLTYLGRTLGAREDSLSYHLIQRVLVDRQWREGTTASRYLADLQRAVRHPSARLLVYERRGGQVAAAITPTTDVLSSRRRGPRALSQLLVIHSADRGMIVTGYQFSELERTGIPGDARWLR